MKASSVSGEDRAALLKIAFAEFIVEWNHLEKSVGFMLFKLVGGDARVEVLTARLQASSMSQALVPLSYIHPDPLRTHIQTFSKLFDRMRAWRNHYVHGIFYVGLQADGPAVGVIQDTSIKGGRLVCTEDQVVEADLEGALERVRSLKRYCDKCVTGILNTPLIPVDWETVIPPEPAPDLPRGAASPFLKLRDD